MANRLQELLQQRALIKEHLAWLEEEIVAAGGELSASGESSPRPLTRPAVPPALTVGTVSPIPVAPSAVTRHAADAQAEALLRKLAAEEDRAKPLPSKTGCWMIFSAVLLVSILGGWLLISHFSS